MLKIWCWKPVHTGITVAIVAAQHFTYLTHPTWELSTSSQQKKDNFSIFMHFSVNESVSNK